MTRTRHSPRKSQEHMLHDSAVTPEQPLPIAVPAEGLHLIPPVLLSVLPASLHKDRAETHRIKVLLAVSLCFPKGTKLSPLTTGQFSKAKSTEGSCCTTPALPQSRAHGVTAPQNIPSWKVPKSSSWVRTAPPKTQTLCLIALSKCLLNSSRLSHNKKSHLLSRTFPS